MDQYTRYREPAGSWIPRPDQSGYPPLRRSARTINLALPPQRPPTPTINDQDPENCHRTLRDHRRAMKARYRRVVENQMRAEEAPQAHEGLRPFRWDASDVNEPLLPSLKRAMDESGGDATRAWERFDRRSSEEKLASDVAKREREVEVRWRIDEMIREEKEKKEDDEMREFLDEIPIYRYPEMNNAIPFTSLIGNIQEQIHAPIRDISITQRGNQYFQLDLSQVLGWVQQDCAQADLERVILISSDELDRYCCFIADQIFHHLSASFKKHNYLPRLRNAQARLRTLKKDNSDLREENKRLKSKVEDFSQVDPNRERYSFFGPGVQRLGRPQQPLTNGEIVPSFHDKHLQTHSLYRATNENGKFPEYWRGVNDFDNSRNNYGSINQEYQQPQRSRPYQDNIAIFPNEADMAMEYQGRQINRIQQDLPETHYGLQYSPKEPEEIQTPLHRDHRRGRAYDNGTLARKVPVKKASTISPYKRARNQTRKINQSLPEPDPVTGYGTVVGVDEVGPIFDYSNIERVTMRGGAGNLLEDDDDEDYVDVMDNAASVLSGASKSSKLTQSLGNGALNRIKRFTADDDDDAAETDRGNEKGSVTSAPTNVFNTSSLKYTRHGDTVSSDPNNRLWGGEQMSSFGVANSVASSANSTHPNRHGYRGQRKRGKPKTIAPALIPYAQKKDTYAQESRGFIFSVNQPDNVPLAPTWTTLDPKTAKVKYEDGGDENSGAQHYGNYSWNPSHPSNNPLAATFGTANVVFATETTDKTTSDANGLTAKSLQRLGSQRRHTEGSESIADYIDISASPPGSPNAPPSVPSAVASSMERGFDSISEQDRNSLFVDDKMTDNPPELIEADVKANFIMNISAAYDVRPPPSIIDQRNQDWVPNIKKPVAYINEFGEGNSVEVTMKAETRTRMMNEKGEYDGKDLGQVKKRYLRGHFEMVDAREKEMIRASKDYREWMGMSIEERMRRLTLVRQPIRFWNGRPGADPDDQHEVNDLPAIYKRRVDNRKARLRMRAILAAKAQQKRQDATTSASVGSVGTTDTRDTIGRLGDCDSLPVRSARGGSRTPQQENGGLRTPGQLDELLQHALDADLSEETSHIISSNLSIQGEAGFELPDRLFAGGRFKPRKDSFAGSSTGNSVAGPRQTTTSSNGRPSPSPLQSPGPWSPMNPPESRGDRTSRRASSVSDAASTVKGLRNASLSGRIHSGAGNDKSSQGTNAANDFAELLAYDDSPLLTQPEDTDIMHGPVTGDAAKMYGRGTENSQNRGRVVTVRLHALPGGKPKFTPSAIADRVFGGLVQEFQLHPRSRTAVVVFVHPIEARSFVHHVRNVREKGTEQEIRELQVEVSWYKGTESQSILAAQPNLLKLSILTSATRCILLSGIPKYKLLRIVTAELSERLGKLLLSIRLITPPQHYLLESVGRQVMLEFASLPDAVEAFEALKTGSIEDYEDVDPEFRMEGTVKRAGEKGYCGCLGCDEKRKEKKEKRAENAERRETRERRREEARGLGERGSESMSVSGIENERGTSESVGEGWERSMSWGLGDEDEDDLVLSSVYDSESD